MFLIPIGPFLGHGRRNNQRVCDNRCVSAGNIGYLNIIIFTGIGEFFFPGVIDGVIFVIGMHGNRNSGARPGAAVTAQRDAVVILAQFHTISQRINSDRCGTCARRITAILPVFFYLDLLHRTFPLGIQRHSFCSQCDRVAILEKFISLLIVRSCCPTDEGITVMRPAGNQLDLTIGVICTAVTSDLGCRILQDLETFRQRPVTSVISRQGIPLIIIQRDFFPAQDNTVNMPAIIALISFSVPLRVRLIFQDIPQNKICFRIEFNAVRTQDPDNIVYTGEKIQSRCHVVSQIVLIFRRIHRVSIIEDKLLRFYGIVKKNVADFPVIGSSGSLFQSGFCRKFGVRMRARLLRNGISVETDTKFDRRQFV